MKHDQDSDWEIVDKLPGERKRRRRPVPRKTPLYKSSVLWVGISLGLLAALAFPPVALLIRKLASLWWLAIIVAIYYLSKRFQSRRR